MTLSGASPPQEARNVLPLSLKTELVMTGTHDQWKEMLKLRLSPKAHPQMHYLMKKLVELPGFPLEDIEVPKWQPELGMEGDRKMTVREIARTLQEARVEKGYNYKDIAGRVG